MNAKQFDQETRFLIDFVLASVPSLVGLDVPPAAAARMLGIVEEDLIAYLTGAEQEVQRTAPTLLAEPDLMDAIDRWPTPQGGAIMAVGDSITIHRYGYAEILRSMLAQRRSDDDIRFINVAQSGYTSADGLLSTYTQYLAHQPDWAFIMFGCNDCKRLDGARTLVSIVEYRENMRGIVRAFREHTPARVILMTPTPVIEAMIDADPDFRAARMRWDNRDLAACAEAVHQVADEYDVQLIDVHTALGIPDPSIYVEDGLHPNAEGQRRMAAHIIRELARVF